MIAVILWAVIGGAIIGALGRLILPGRQNVPVWATIGVGVAAALIGGVLAFWLGVGVLPGADWVLYAIQIGLAVLFVSLIARAQANRPGAGAMRRPMP
ncbi:MAG TPA: GlsB/YeaQ/YmgE family stress response membrane protein [Micromonosporaceae bacterium]|nr:GlsB/YeaQ/YmgE family stress response membrane protein [Micromonosporaceae bacterium]